MNLPVLRRFLVAEGGIGSGDADKVVGGRLPSGDLGVDSGNEPTPGVGTRGVGSGGNEPAEGIGIGGAAGVGSEAATGIGIEGLGGGGNEPARDVGISGVGGGGNDAATLPDPASNAVALEPEGELTRDANEGGGGGLLVALDEESRAGGVGSGGRADTGIGGLTRLAARPTIGVANDSESSPFRAGSAGSVVD